MSPGVVGRPPCGRDFQRGTRTNNIDRHRRDRSGEYNSAPSELPSLGYGDDVLNEVGVLLERIDNRLTLGNLSLVKRYCDGNLKLVGKAAWGSINFNIICDLDPLWDALRRSPARHRF
jgi:hypothetical protein